MEIFTYIAACAISIALLYLPGYFLLRSSGFSRTWSLCISPVISAFLFTILAIIWCKLGVPCNAATIALPPILIGLILFYALSHSKKQISQINLPRISAKMLCLYGALGLFAAWFIFLRVLPDFSTFAQAWDNQHHINGIRAFADSQCFNTLQQTPYQTAVDQIINPTPDAGFYPSTWMMFCAIIVQLLNVSAGIAENAVDLILSAVVYPLSMAAFFCVLFKGNTRKVALGSIACIVFPVFPWEMLAYGPLLPNLASFSYMPIALALTISALSLDKPRSEQIKLFVLFIFSCIGLTFTHPNSIFTMGVLLAPFFMQLIATSRGLKLGRVHISSFVLAFVFVLLCILVWVLAYQAPFLQNVIHLNVYKATYSTYSEAVINVLTLSYLKGFCASAPQYASAVLVFFGVIRTFKDRKYLWLLISYLLTCIILIASIAGEETIRAFFAGFWYSDPFRCATMATLAAMPLLILGFDWVITSLITVGNKVLPSCKDANKKPLIENKLNKGLCIALGTLLCIIALAPNLDANGERDEKQSRTASDVISYWYTTTHGPYTPDENQFCHDALEIVGTSLVINQPNDGSLFTFGETGMRVYYRQFNGYGFISETTEGKLMREHLCDIATREDVQEACRKLGVEYVLILHRSNMPESFISKGYYKWAWVGIDNITDTTPGFEVVLAQDDMRLYRITWE